MNSPSGEAPWQWLGTVPKMSDDPIASDPALLWTWTRIVIALVTLLAISVGASSTDTIDIGSLIDP
jgi:hypothetical protein